MWLPEDERKLLRCYYEKQGGESDGYVDITGDVITSSIKLLHSRSEFNEYTAKKVNTEKAPYWEKVQTVNKRLQDRGLLDVTSSPTGSKQAATGGVIYLMRRMTFTTEGYDLARKYSHWFTRWGLCWQEHKGNPIWLIIGFVITAVVSYITGKLTN